MKFVGSHDAANFVAAALVIEACHARPKARDFKDKFGAVRLQELDIQGHLIVLPDVIGDGTANVPLQVGIVG
jgi:hypothetical protein